MVRNVVYVLAAALMVSCSGGGSSSPSQVPPPTVDTTSSLEILAGVAPETSGTLDGPSAQARFDRPASLTTDSTGAIYVVDGTTVRKVFAGFVTTIAGSPYQPGSVDGPGAAARFGGAAGIVSDGAGTLYVADYGNNTIRKIASDGTVSTFAGALEAGSADGHGTEARFHGPSSIAIDSAGNLYVSDAGNLTIRRIARDATVTTIAGMPGASGYVDGLGPAARFASVCGLAVDSAGNLFVADLGNLVIRKIAPSGVVSTFAGRAGVQGRADGDSATATFYNPINLASDSNGDLYVMDHDRLRKITAAGVVSTVAGPPQGLDISFALTVDATGKVLIADTVGSRILQWSGGAITTVAGPMSDNWSGYVDGPGAQARFAAADSVATDAAGNVYAFEGDKVRRISTAGVVTTLATTDGNAFDAHLGIGIDAAGNVYAPHSTLCPITPNVGFPCVERADLNRIDPAGHVTRIAIAGSSDGTFPLTGYMQAFAVDPSGNAFVADYFYIHRVSPDGTITTFASGMPDISTMTTDSSGNLYVAQHGQNTPSIVKIDAAGNHTPIVDVPGTPSYAAAGLGSPAGLAVDSAGNLYVADGARQVILKITPAGSVSIVAGADHSVGFRGGALPGSLDLLHGIAIHGSNLYIAMWSAIAVVRNTP